MAKKEKEKEEVAFADLSDAEKHKKIGKALDILKEQCGICTTLENAQSNVDSFEDTGCYILNALLSGELRGGFPEGRMSVMAAESSVGKSYIGLQTAALAQRKGKTVVIFDSEYAIDKEFGRNMGLDPQNTIHVPVKTIEETRSAIFKFLNHVIENKMQGQFFILVDSLANMVSELEMTRAEKGSTAMDQGTIPRAMKSFIKMCITMSGQSKTTIVCTNHVYDDPAALHPSLVKKQPGGKAVSYLPSTVLQLSAVNVKEGDDRKIGEEATIGGKGLLGKAVTGLSIKNRICKPFVTADMYISWRTGLSKYYGLLELAQEFGLIVNRVGRYYFASDPEKCIGTRKELIVDAEFWEKYMPELQKALNKEWHYNSFEDRLAGEKALKEELGVEDEDGDGEE